MQKERATYTVAPGITQNVQIVRYRVAQNKIPHQTICNIFATSGQILIVLRGSVVV